MLMYLNWINLTVFSCVVLFEQICMVQCRHWTSSVSRLVITCTTDETPGQNLLTELQDWTSPHLSKADRTLAASIHRSMTRLYTDLPPAHLWARFLLSIQLTHSFHCHPTCLPTFFPALLSAQGMVLCRLFWLVASSVLGFVSYQVRSCRFLKLVNRHEIY